LDSLHRLRASIEKGISEARFLSRRFNPTQVGGLEGHGLILLLQELADHQSARVDVALLCEKAVAIKDPNAALALYRAVLDVYANPGGDALARQKIVVSVSREEEMVVLQINDSQRLEPQAEKTIRTRMLAMGGELTVCRSPNRETILTCRVPDYPPRETSAPESKRPNPPGGCADNATG
jgi:signal transduction histidine kinase